MDAAYQEYQILEEIDSLLAAWLDKGLTLAQMLRGEIKLDEGTKTTFLPEDVDAHGIDFYENGCKGLSLGPPRDWLIQKIKEFLSLGEDRIVVLEDELSKSSDKGISGEKAKISTYKEEVYYYINTTDIRDPGYISNTLKEADWANYVFIGIMSSLPKSCQNMEQRLNTDTITLLAKRTKHIIFGAFDGQGYIIWSGKE